MLPHLIKTWDTIVPDLSKMQVAYIILWSFGENTVRNVYQRELPIHKTFSNRKWMIFFHGFEFIYSYVDDLLVLAKGFWIDCVQKI